MARLICNPQRPCVSGREEALAQQLRLLRQVSLLVQLGCQVLELSNPPTVYLQLMHNTWRLVGA